MPADRPGQRQLTVDARTPLEEDVGGTEYPQVIPGEMRTWMCQATSIAGAELPALEPRITAWNLELGTCWIVDPSHPIPPSRQPHQAGRGAPAVSLRDRPGRAGISRLCCWTHGNRSSGSPGTMIRRPSRRPGEDCSSLPSFYLSGERVAVLAGALPRALTELLGEAEGVLVAGMEADFAHRQVGLTQQLLG